MLSSWMCSICSCSAASNSFPLVPGNSNRISLPGDRQRMSPSLQAVLPVLPGGDHK